MKRKTRRIFGAVLSLMLIVSAFSVFSFAPSAAAVDISIQDFESGTADALTTNLGRPTTRILDTENAAAGNSLKVTYEDGTDAWNVIFLTITTSDWTGATYLKFWLKNPNGASAAFDLFVEDDTRHVTTAGSPAYIIPDSTGTATQVSIGINARISVPANFTGYVMVPFTSFSDSASLDLSAITALAFCCDAVENYQKSFYFDSFSATNAAPGSVVVSINTCETAASGHLDGRPGTVEQDTANKIEGTGSVKVTFGEWVQGGPEPGNGMAWNDFWIHKDVGISLTGTSNVRFWIFNPNDAAMSFGLTIYDSSWHIWRTTAGAAAYIINSETDAITEIALTNGTFNVDAGTGFYVVIPYASLSCDNCDEIELGAVQRIVVNCGDTAMKAGKSFNVDDVTADSVDYASQIELPPLPANQLTGFENDTNAARFVSKWDDGALLGLDIVADDHKSEGSQSLKFTIEGLNPNGVSPAGCMFVNFKQKDWSGTGGLAFWVENVNEVGLDFDFFFENTDGIRRLSKEANGTCYFLPDGADKATQGTFNYRILIPAGYRGYVYIPFESFQYALWSVPDDWDGEFDMTSIKTLGFGIDATNFVGKIMYFDDIKLFTALPEVEEQPTEDSSSDTSSEEPPAETADSISTVIAFMAFTALAGLAVIPLKKRNRA